MQRALTIAGSDSGGGAGIQADLKTFCALGVYGMSALTAMTAQNTQGVSSVLQLPDKLIAEQIQMVLEDLGSDAIKIGMLGSASAVQTVATTLRAWRSLPLVLDPVMVAKSGDRLLQEDAIQALKAELLPLADVLTPNLPEAEVLVGRSLSTLESRKDACLELVERWGSQAVLLKGGHLKGPLVDLLYDGNELHEFVGQRLESRSTHGTGCTLSAAIAALLARGWSLVSAVREAREYLFQALLQAPGLGKGHGPVQHLHPFKAVHTRWQWPQAGESA